MFAKVLHRNKNIIKNVSRRNLIARNEVRNPAKASNNHQKPAVGAKKQPSR